MALPIVTNPNPPTYSADVTKLYLKLGATPLLTDLVPLMSDAQITFNSSKETIPLYNNGGASITVKTGLEGTISIETIGPSNHPVVAALVTAGFATGPGAELFYIMELAEGSYIYGIISVDKAEPKTPVRGASRWMFPASTTGKVNFQAI